MIDPCHIKFVEIRDHATFIPALAIRIDGTAGYLARRAGFGDTVCIYLIALATERCAYDPFNWGSGDRTMKVAHGWLTEHWDEHEDGAIIDVEFVLGESLAPKQSERGTYLEEAIHD